MSGSCQLLPLARHILVGIPCTTRTLMPKPVISGLYYGGVDHFIAPDGRPMVTGIRKRLAATGFLGTKGFPDDASAEPAHHTQARLFIYFRTRTTGFLRRGRESFCRGLHSARILRRPGR